MGEAAFVNEEKPAGSYEVEFKYQSDESQNLPADRQGLSSGVYFYQLVLRGPETSLPAGQAGSGQAFVQTKKMIYLR